MPEVIGDIVMPSELTLPQLTTAEANSLSGATPLSGLMIYNKTLAKVEFYTPLGWETITSAAR